jgi:hypothetical protein
MSLFPEFGLTVQTVEPTTKCSSEDDGKPTKSGKNKDLFDGGFSNMNLIQEEENTGDFPLYTYDPDKQFKHPCNCVEITVENQVFDWASPSNKKVGVDFSKDATRTIRLTLPSEVPIVIPESEDIREVLDHGVPDLYLSKPTLVSKGKESRRNIRGDLSNYE